LLMAIRSCTRGNTMKMKHIVTFVACLGILFVCCCAHRRAPQEQALLNEDHTDNDALMQESVVSEEPLKVVEATGDSPRASNAPLVLTEQAQASPGTSTVRSQKQAVVTGIRYVSEAAPTRIVIDLNQEVTYHGHFLREDSARKKPSRLYIDLAAAKLSPHLKQTIPIEDGLLTRVRAGQHTSDTVRVVLDLERAADYKIFSLADPIRVVIEILGTSPTAKKEEHAILSARSQPPSFFIQQFNVVQIEKQEVAIEDLLKEYKKTLCKYFANTVKTCYSLKKDGVAYTDALSKTEAIVKESIVEDHRREHVFRVTKDACTIAYSLPQDAMNIEQTYCDYCMEECTVALKDDRPVLASFVDTPMIATPPPDVSESIDKERKPVGQFEILEAKMRVIKKYTDWDYVQCSWLVKIRNNTEEELKLGLTIDYVDNKGFKLEDSHKSVHLKSYETTTVSDTCPLFSTDVFEQIYQLKARAKKY
jgi:hypothetical protein